MHKNNSVKCFMSPFYAVCCVFTHSFTSPTTFSFIGVYKDDAVSNSECCWEKNARNNGITSRKLQSAREMKATLAHAPTTEKKARECNACEL